MTVQALYTAATGMQAMETKLDVVANNLANINTTAFKKGRANFEDLFYRHYQMPGAADSQLKTGTGSSVGLGTRALVNPDRLQTRCISANRQSVGCGH